MLVGVRVVIATVVAIAAVVLGVPTAASASGASPLGYDISYPQCSKSTAVNKVQHAFGIVGVNSGRAIGFNPCFASEVLWAGVTDTAASEQTPLSFYINTGNPSRSSPQWPTSNATLAGTSVVNPHGTCVGKKGSACAYVYGYSAAEADFSHVSGVMSGIDVAARTWWLDVETANSWQPDRSANSADLSGMVDYLSSKGAKVGVYSTSYQWNIIAGATSPSSHLSGLQSWLAGAGTASRATTFCSLPPLTPRGRVSLVQYVSGNLDHDVSCHTFNAPAPTISGNAAVGNKLAAKAGSWNGSPKLKYQWLRSGAKISGATSAGHTVTRSDLGKSLRVVVSAKKTGYNSQSRTSAPVTVTRSLSSTPKPTVSGTATVGKTLTANPGTWRPSPVTLAFQWTRDGVAIAGATAKTYALVEADGGQTITVSVTGSRSGYRSVTETSSTHVVTAAP